MHVHTCTIVFRQVTLCHQRNRSWLPRGLQVSCRRPRRPILHCFDYFLLHPALPLRVHHLEQEERLELQRTHQGNSHLRRSRIFSCCWERSGVAAVVDNTSKPVIWYTSFRASPQPLHKKPVFVQYSAMHVQATCTNRCSKRREADGQENSNHRQRA